MNQTDFRWQPLAFLAIGLLLHSLFYITYTRTVGPSHRVSEVDARWTEEEGPINVLILGGSHARNAVDPSFMSGTTSLAVGGEQYIKTHYRLRYLFAKRDRDVSVVLLPLDAASLSSWKTDSYSPEYVWGKYIDFWEQARIQGKPFAYARMWTKARLFPYAGELETLEQLWVGSRAFKKESQAQVVPPKSERRNGQEAAADHLAGYDHADPALTWALRRIVAELRAREIRVVLVTYPMSAGYSRAARDLGADMSPQHALLAELGAPGAVDHLDFEGLFHGKPDNFYDGDHLSRTGRMRFSRLLRQKLLALGVQP